MDYDKARELAEDIVHDWYSQEQGWYDSLPADAIEALEESIAQGLMRASKA